MTRLRSLLTATGALALAASAIVTMPASAQPAHAHHSAAWNGDIHIIVPNARRQVWREARIAPVELTAAGATIDIDGQTATTRLEIALTNKDGRPQEAQVVIPVPDGAIVRSFQYDGTGPEPTAHIISKDEARRLYDDIVAKSKDPGLLEFTGLNLIKSSVFPIPGGATQKVRIVYEQVLVSDAGRLDFFLPRTESLSAGGIAWSIKGTIKNAQSIASVYSPSHDLVTDTTNNITSFRVTDQGAKNPGSFRLSLMARPTDGDGAVASLFAYPDATLGPDSGYFLLLMNVAKPGKVEGTIPNREITLVFDRSGSMRGQKIEQAKAAALNVLQGIKDEEFFNIVDYSDSVASFAKSPVTMTGKARAEAEAYIKRLEAEGGTNIGDALTTALTPAPQPGALPIVLFLTDGLPTVGETRESALRDGAAKANVHKRRLFTFGVGYDVNSPLLSALARGSRGAPTFVLPDENVEQKVSQVFRRLQGPILSEPALAALVNNQPDTRVIRDVLPRSLPDVFEGDQLVIVGQYHNTRRLDLRITGKAGEAERVHTLSFGVADASAKDSFVARLWANRKIAVLIEQIRDSQADGGVSDPRADPKTKELVDEIVRLSTRWGILTEYTSFIALEPGFALRGQAAQVEEALKRLSERGADRAGAAGMSQVANTGGMQSGAADPKRQAWLDADMKEVEVTTVTQVADQTFYRRGNRWVDGRVQAKEGSEPDEIVEVGTTRFNEVLDTLRTQNLLGVLALEGEVEVQMGAKRVLIRQRG